MHKWFWYCNWNLGTFDLSFSIKVDVIMGGMDGHTQYNIRLFFVRYLRAQNDFFKKKHEIRLVVFQFCYYFIVLPLLYVYVIIYYSYLTMWCSPRFSRLNDVHLTIMIDGFMEREEYYPHDGTALMVFFSVWIVTLPLFLPIDILNVIFKVVCRDR